MNQLSGSEPQTVGKLTMRVQTAQTTRSLVSEMVWQIEQGRDSAMPPRLLTRPKQRRCGVKSKVHMGRRASRAPGKAPAPPSFSQIVRMTQASLSVNERSGDDQRRRALQSGLSRISGVPWPQPAWLATLEAPTYRLAQANWTLRCPQCAGGTVNACLSIRPPMRDAVGRRSQTRPSANPAKGLAGTTRDLTSLCAASLSRMTCCLTRRPLALGALRGG